MADYNEARLLLTTANVQSWARANFPVPFAALPRAARMQWIEFDESSFVISRPTWRSLGRSAHKQLLIIGSYAPGAHPIQEPTDPVAAHVHMEETEVSFYRIAKTSDGSSELQPVHSTSTVAFHAPFCDVGDDTGGSEAIHRVSSLIIYYFLAAGHVKELVRSRLDPTMFTKYFKDACFWVQNGGERPIAPPSRRLSSAATTTAPPETITVRPKRSTTTPFNRYPIEAFTAPRIQRSSTDDVIVKRKQFDETPARSRKYPRRTLSEQIQIPKLLSHESITSPRSPAPERVNKALSDRIQHLKNENADLRARMAQQKKAYESKGTCLETELASVNARLRSMETASEQLQANIETLRKRVDRTEEDITIVKSERIIIRRGR